MELQDRLVDYFRSRENKSIVLDNKAEVKLVYAITPDRELVLMFEHDYDNIKIKFRFYNPKDDDFITMEVPEGYVHAKKIVVGSMEQIGYIINNSLYNWVENKDIGLEWRD